MNIVALIYKIENGQKSTKEENQNNESRFIVPHAVVEVGIHKETKVTLSTLMLGLPKYT